MLQHYSPDWIAVGVSIIALLGTGYTYIIHGRKLQTQQKQINEYQLKKNIEEENEKQKAQLECNIVKSGISGKSNKLVIYNKGKSEAWNITFDVPDGADDRVFFYIESLSYPKLLPQQSFNTHYMGSSSRQVVKIKWSDSSGDNRIIEQIVDF